MNDAPATRRHLLATVGLVAGAGCLESLPFGSTGVPLGSMLVSNASDDPQSVRMTLQRAGETVYDDTVEVDADDYEIVHPTWSTEPATYTLEYATDDGSDDPTDDASGTLSLPEDANTVPEDADAEDCVYLVFQFDPYVGFSVQPYADPVNDDLRC